MTQKNRNQHWMIDLLHQEKLWNKSLCSWIVCNSETCDSEIVHIMKEILKYSKVSVRKEQKQISSR